MSELTEEKPTVNSSVLPPGWENVSVRDIADSIQYGHTASAIESADGPRFLRITDIQNGCVAWANVPSCVISREDLSKYRIKAGDLVFARTGATTGKSFLIRDCPEAVFASYLIRVRVSSEIDERFLALFFKSPNYWHQIEGGKRGIGQPNVNGNVLGQIRFSLPPLAEQKRIVAKIEELFSELEAGEESLRVARRQLGVYRQSLLKQAFEGNLTAQWRTQNPDKLVKPTASSAKLDAEPGSVPPGWVWQALSDVAEVSGGLTKNSKRDGLPTRISYLRVANVYANELRLGEIKDIGVTAAEAKKVRLVKGDLLIVEGNGSLDQIGRVAAWDGSIPECGHQNHLIRARCLPGAHYAFVLMFLLSPHGRDVIEKQAASTSGLHTLSVSKVQRLPIPLCSLPEQQEIVRLLDEQFEGIERNEREIDGALRKSAVLRQAILHRAFTGRLVPQDPADEPGSVLLARLRAERAAEPAKPRKKRSDGSG